MTTKKYFDLPDKNTKPVREKKKKLEDLISDEALKITDERTMDYNSPTGRGYIGIAKRPLQKVDEGFGFKGVLIQTDNRTLVQCHECGYWFTELGRHVRKHGMTSVEYKDKYDLSQKNSLCSDATSYRRELVARKAWADPEYRAAREKELRERSPKAIKAALKSKRHNKRSIEFENEYGNCELQLKVALIQWVKKYKDLPSRSNKKGRAQKLCTAIWRKHGESLNNGFEHYGLPRRHRKGTTVELIAPNGEQFFFNYNKGYDKNEVYTWMLEHCPVLSEQMPEKIDKEDYEKE